MVEGEYWQPKSRGFESRRSILDNVRLKKRKVRKKAYGKIVIITKNIIISLNEFYHQIDTCFAMTAVGKPAVIVST